MKYLKVFVMFLTLGLVFSCLACDKKKNDDNIDVSGVVFNDATFIYDGSPKSITCQNVPDGVSVTYEGNGQQAIGVYEVKANLNNQKSNKTLKTLTAKLTIMPNIDVSSVKFEDKEFEYDGAAHEILCTNVPEGVVVTYLANKQTAVGKYQATAILTYNTVVLKTLTATITIKEASTITPTPVDPTPTPDIPTTGKYYLVINGTKYIELTGGDPWDMDASYTQYQALEVELNAGDIISFYDAENAASWATMTIDEYSASGFTQEDDGIKCSISGTYNCYIKMKFGADNIYFGLA